MGPIGKVQITTDTDSASRYASTRTEET